MSIITNSTPPKRIEQNKFVLVDLVFFIKKLKIHLMKQLLGELVDIKGIVELETSISKGNKILS